jgi:hypothetical protein
MYRLPFTDHGDSMHMQGIEASVQIHRTVNIARGWKITQRSNMDGQMTTDMSRVGAMDSVQHCEGKDMWPFKASLGFKHPEHIARMSMRLRHPIGITKRTDMSDAICMVVQPLPHYEPFGPDRVHHIVWVDMYEYFSLPPQ